MHDCPTCGLPTSDGNFCVRCGAPLDQQLTHTRERKRFAGAPAENRFAPWLVSTLFPQLPRHSERHFHIALFTGGALVVVLGALRLFPIALISAALLMPLLTVLYFYDVDIYEGEPTWATSCTLAWGAAMGVLVGLLAKAVAPTGLALIDRGSTAHVVTGGLLLPTLGVLLMLAGPATLLRYRRFNDVLDGVGFGAACAATFAAAEAVVVGVGILSGGLRPAAAALPWVERLLAIAVATPVLAMSAVGAATGALWLRYRAPVTDRHVLGPFGSPPVAALIAILLVAAGAVTETFMPAGAWLGWLVLLDLVGLVLLRRVIHVGLLEESAEEPIGPTIRCANCGASTDSHTFCANCGIALKALPKTRPDDTDEAPAAGRGISPGRLAAERHGRPSGHRRLIVYAALAGLTALIALVVGLLAAPPPRPSICRPGVQCGSPPVVAHQQFAFPGYTTWQSSALGDSLRYNSRNWRVVDQGANGVELEAGDGFSVIVVTAVPASQASASALLGHQLSALQGELLGLSSDPDQGDALLGTNVGFVPGPGGVYTATVASPEGPEAPASIAIIAADNGRASIAVTVIAPGNNPDDKRAVYQQADDIIDSIQWP